jgi:hypothetical protein
MTTRTNHLSYLELSNKDGVKRTGTVVMGIASTRKDRLGQSFLILLPQLSDPIRHEATLLLSPHLLGTSDLSPHQQEDYLPLLDQAR